MATDWSSSPPPAAATPTEGSAVGAYARALRNHKLIALALFLLVFTPAMAIALSRSRSYQATARLLVNPLPQDDTTFIGLPLIRDSGDPTRTMQTAATLVDSPQAAQRTALALGNGWSTRRVQSAVSVQPEGQSDILDITASDSSARRAARIANAFAGSALSSRAQQLRGVVAQAIATTTSQLAGIRNTAAIAAADLQDKLNQLRALSSGRDPTLSLSESAAVPTSPSGLSPALIIVLGLVGAVALASAGVLIIELMRTRRLLTEQELFALIPAPVLARVPLLPRRLRRTRSMLRAPLPGAVSEALRGVRIQLDLLRGRHRTILITSAFHGDGKTTTAINLAREMAETGAQVILVDADMRKPDLAPSLELDPLIPLPDALESDQPFSYALSPTTIPALRVLPSWADPEFTSLDRVAFALGAALHEGLEEADYVILDAPPLGEVADVLRLIGLVDDVLLVSRLGHTPMGTLEVARELLDRAGRLPTGHVIIGSSPRHAPGYGYYYSSGERNRATSSPTGNDLPVTPVQRDQAPR